MNINSKKKVKNPTSNNFTVPFVFHIQQNIWSKNKRETEQNRTWEKLNKEDNWFENNMSTCHEYKSQEKSP